MNTRRNARIRTPDDGHAVSARTTARDHHIRDHHVRNHHVRNHHVRDRTAAGAE